MLIRARHLPVWASRIQYLYGRPFEVHFNNDPSTSGLPICRFMFFFLLNLCLNSPYLLCMLYALAVSYYLICRRMDTIQLPTEHFELSLPQEFILLTHFLVACCRNVFCEAACDIVFLHQKRKQYEDFRL